MLFDMEVHTDFSEHHDMPKVRHYPSSVVETSLMPRLDPDNLAVCRFCLCIVLVSVCKNSLLCIVSISSIKRKHCRIGHACPPPDCDIPYRS